MSAIYNLSGFLAGIAATSIAMGGDGLIGMLFVASVGLSLIGAAIEYHQRND